MKKLLSLVLAAILLAAALASCAAQSSPVLDPNITVTSSDAIGAARWLEERLDMFPDRIILGTDAAAYGVDLSSLEDDGYIIRHIDGEIALFARTPEGLDRAARLYAKTVDAGDPVDDVTYHEGYRIEKLLFAGVDAAEYAAIVEDSNEYNGRWVEKNVADTFAKLVKTACGAQLSPIDEAAHRVVFRRIEDESFKESSYHYYFADGDLIFEYADLAGARNGMARFLEDECGWTDLYYGFDDLAEADLVDVPAQTDVICHPRFGGIRMTTMGSFRSDNTLAQLNYEAFSYKYRIPSAHHYLGAVWAKDYGGQAVGHMPCLTSDDVFEVTVEELSENVEGQFASGLKIGEGIEYINLGMEDSNYWCSCKSCLKTAFAEGYTWAGPMVLFANRVEEAMDELGYDGLKYSIFAYAGSNPPPKTVPNDDIYITFVCDGYCTRHSLNGTQCTGQCLSVRNVFGSVTTGNNREEAEWIRGWCELSDNVYVRPAPLLAPMHAFTIIDQTYDDVTFLSECGVKCIYDEIYSSYEIDTNLIVTELWEAMLFDPDMTRTEYYEEVARLFEKYYGSGWQGVFDYVECLEETEMADDGCWSAWNSYAFLSDYTQYDHAVYRELWDRMLDSLTQAEYDADSIEQQRRVKLLRMSALCSGCYSSYYFAYQENDDEKIAMLEERWAELIQITKDLGVYDQFRHGWSPYGLEPHYPDGYMFFDTLEETAWRGAWITSFYRDYPNILYDAGYTEIRPMPEEYR